MEVDIKGLSPGLHGLNVHELGGVSCDDGRCTGDSWNPFGLPHGKRDATRQYGASAAHYLGDGRVFYRHAGDLGNVSADAGGSVREKFEEFVCAFGGETDVVGRSVVVYARPDDFSQPDGNVGAILAYGTVQLA